jgi:abhydrolase domain-containing protein 6
MRPLLLLAVLLLAGCGPIQGLLFDAVVGQRRAAAGLTERTVEVSGRRVAYLERPGDGPTLVLVHGFAASKDSWLAFVAALPAGPRVLVPDLAGHGDSVRDTAAVYDAGRLAAEVSAWLDVVAPGPVHVAGNSLGGEVAALLALDRPDRVETVALYDPAGVIPPTASRRDSMLARGDNILIPTTRPEFDRLLALSFVGDPGIPGPARDVLVADYARRAPFLRDLFDQLAVDPDRFRPRLGDIPQPVLLVWGAQDRIIDPSAAAIWALGLSDVTLQILDGVGHAPMMEAPTVTARAYAAFLDLPDQP